VEISQENVTLTESQKVAIQRDDTEKFPVLSPVQAPLRSITVGPSSKSDPLITIVPYLLKKILSFIPSSSSSIFLRNLTLLDINHDTIIPSFFNDPQVLVHLAFLLDPQIGGEALEKITLDYMEEEEEDADVEVLMAHLLSS